MLEEKDAVTVTPEPASFESVEVLPLGAGVQPMARPMSSLRTAGGVGDKPLGPAQSSEIDIRGGTDGEENTREGPSG